MGLARASLTSFVTGVASRGLCPRSGPMAQHSGSSRESARLDGAAGDERTTHARTGAPHAQQTANMKPRSPMTEKETELQDRVEKIEKAIITITESFAALAENHKTLLRIMAKVAKKEGWKL